MTPATRSARTFPRPGGWAAPRGASGSRTLDRRRGRSLARRIGLCVSTGILVWSLTSMILAMVPTRMIAVAAAGIPRGTMIEASQVVMRAVPDDASFEHAFERTEMVLGLVAAVDIPAGQPLFPSMVRDPPSAPAGETIVAVPLASSGGGLLPGDMVRLLSSECAGGRSANGDDSDARTDPVNDAMERADADPRSGTAPTYGQNYDEDPSEHMTSESMCVVAPHATIMELPEAPHESTDASWSLAPTEESSMTMLSMDPKSALLTLSLRETTAIVAIAIDGDD